MRYLFEAEGGSRKILSLSFFNIHHVDRANGTDGEAINQTKIGAIIKSLPRPDVALFNSPFRMVKHCLFCFLEFVRLIKALIYNRESRFRRGAAMGIARSTRTLYRKFHFHILVRAGTFPAIQALRSVLYILHSYETYSYRNFIHGTLLFVESLKRSRASRIPLNRRSTSDSLSVLQLNLNVLRPAKLTFSHSLVHQVLPNARCRLRYR